jgi:AraC-like DNA-binding protein
MLYLGPGATAAKHQHHALQLVWSPEKPILLETSTGSVQTHAALIPANREHSLSATGQRLLVLLVERHGGLGRALHQVACAADALDLAERLQSVAFPEASLSSHELMRWSETLVAALGHADKRQALSTAIRLAIHYVEQQLPTTPSLAGAAQNASISPTRLTHRFTSEVGIPFRRFVLWSRLKRAAQEAATSNLTEAAHAAGFSDSAHLSRTFRAMFGLAPSLVLPRMEFAPLQAAQALAISQTL